MLDDSYGNRVSTNSIEATMSYNAGVHQFLGAEPGVEVSFRAAISADPNFTLALVCNSWIIVRTPRESDS